MTDGLLTTTRDDLRAWDVLRHVPLVALRSTHWRFPRRRAPET